MNPELKKKVEQLLAQNDIVGAVGLVNKVLGCGLRKAKELVDELR